MHHLAGVCAQLLLASLSHAYRREALVCTAEVSVYALLAQAAYAQLVVDAGDGSHLLRAVKVGCGNPAHQLGTLLPVGTLASIDEHVSLLVRHDVAADGLAEHGRVAVNVEQVVLQLEGQPYLLAKLVERVGISLGGVGQYGPHLL